MRTLCDLLRSSLRRHCTKMKFLCFRVHHCFLVVVVSVVVSLEQSRRVLLCHAFVPLVVVVQRPPLSALAAAPGVIVASASDLRRALQNPATTVIDARSLEELQATGYYRGCDGQLCRWVHAPASKVDAPLLELAAASLIPDPTAPVVIYCALGFRAASSQRVLQAAGYTNVLNAGGFDDIMKFASPPPRP
jgi:phage shock protein E